MKWEVEYYNQNVKASIMRWPKNMLSRYLRVIKLIEEDGPNLGMPFTKAMGDGLFEIRVKAQEGVGRVFFCYAIGGRVIILHDFIKKEQNTPKKDLRIARKFMKEVRRNEV